MERKGRLSCLTKTQLWDEFMACPYPKWSTLCLLNYLEFPTPDAVFMDWKYTESKIRDIIAGFAAELGLSRILVRTDGGREKGAYPRGGNTLKLQRAFEFVLQQKTAHRVAILMEPTNRFTNRRAINQHLVSSGELHIEILGPGFDVSDLNRGLLNPEISILITNIDWGRYDPPHPLFVTRRLTHVSSLRKARLQRIGSELLPSIGIQSEGPPAAFAENWLRENNFVQLFEETRPTITFRQIRRLYDSAFLIGTAYRRKSKWENLVVSFSDLGSGGRSVFWDIFNPGEKFWVQ